jgi:hypothetical protein
MGDDDTWYVVKFYFKGQQRRRLINDWIGSQLLNELVPIPPISLIYTDQEFIKSHQLAFADDFGCIVDPTLGYHFASRFPGHPERTTVYDYLPRGLTVDNEGDFITTFLFDMWTRNVGCDRQAVFVRATSANGGKTSFTAKMIDNTELFGGPNWSFNSALSFTRSICYTINYKLFDLESYLEPIRTYPSDIIDKIFSSVPFDWIDGDQRELHQVKDTLIARREHTLEDLQRYLTYIDGARICDNELTHCS